MTPQQKQDKLNALYFRLQKDAVLCEELDLDDYTAKLHEMSVAVGNMAATKAPRRNASKARSQSSAPAHQEKPCAHANEVARNGDMYCADCGELL